MIKYYTRPCNFIYGKQAQSFIKKKRAKPLCGNKNIAFTSIDLIKRVNKKIKTQIIKIENINSLPNEIKKKVLQNLKNICKKRKLFNLKKDNSFNPLIMGILNLTPDSFSDGGKYNSRKKAFLRVKELVDSGADIIDVGGESTRPGSKTIRPNIEWQRVEFLVKSFKKKYKKSILSVDTRKSEVMSKALKYNADIINDVSGFNYDSNSINIFKNHNVWKIVHHMQGSPNTMQINPKYQNVLLEIYDFFEDKIKSDLKNVKFKEKIILDPGIGFGKNLKHNLKLLSEISIFHSLGFPVLVGTSKKRFINHLSGKYDTKLRMGGTVASVVHAMMHGVQIVRVHEVKEIKQATIVFKNLLSI